MYMRFVVGSHAGMPLKNWLVTAPICSRWVAPAVTSPLVYTTMKPVLFFAAT